MSSRDDQKKFYEKSNIRQSEYARNNTNNTKGANQIARGNSLLPQELEQKRDSSNLVINIIGISLGILLFIFIAPLGEKIFSKEFYSGTLYLFLSLLFSIGFPWLIIIVIKLYRK